MPLFCFLLSFILLIFSHTVHAQSVIKLPDVGGLHAAYVVPTDEFDRVDVQLIVHSGSFDDPETAGTAHLVEHLAAFSSDATVLRNPRERDIHASVNEVSTVYTNSGKPNDVEKLLRLSRAVLDTPKLPPGFAESEIRIIQRETMLRERQSPRLWLKRFARKNLYGATWGRANDIIEDLPKLGLEEAYRFHKEHYVPSNVTLIVSGKVQLDLVEELIAGVFGDTKPSLVPGKPWLDHRPDPSHNSVFQVETEKLQFDTIQLIKFVEFEDRSTSVDMQGAFFIATEILNSRLINALYFENEKFVVGNLDWHFVKNADLEFAIEVQLMPGLTLNAAHRDLNNTIINLLSEPISKKEISQARKKELTHAQSVKRHPARFLLFLQNVAADGFAPVSPSTFAETLANTTDQEVIDFAKTFVEPSAMSVILAKKVY